MPTTFKVEYTFATDAPTAQPRFLSFDTHIEAQAVERALAAVLSDLNTLHVKEVACLGSKEFSPVELETIRFLAQVGELRLGATGSTGRVQAIKLIRYLAQSGLREASDFLNGLCPRDEGPKPCGEIPLVPAQPCVLAAPEAQRLFDRGLVIKALVEAIYGESTQGFQNYTDAMLVEAANRYRIEDGRVLDAIDRLNHQA